MEDIGSLLFKKSFAEKTLFKNQLDLVHQIIATNVYPFNKSNDDEFSKFQIRLKTYVSQLLSDTAVRNITDEFRTALQILVRQKILDTSLSEKILEEIFDRLKTKNVHSQTNKGDSVEAQIEKDLMLGNYISIISAKPIEINRLRQEDDFSLSYSLFKNYILSHLENDNLKYYRLNFPLESYCELFWLGFQKMIFHELLELFDGDYLNNLVSKEPVLINGIYSIIYQKFKDFVTLTGKKFNEETKNEICLTISNSIVEYLNKHKIVLTFHITDPIFSTTTIALSPDNLNKGKVYFLIEDEFRKMRLFKPNKEGLLLWRIFVCDKIKTSKTSKNIERPTDIGSNIINQTVE